MTLSASVSFVPRVEKNDTEADKVIYIPRHERKAVFEGRSGDHAVHNRRRDPSLSGGRGQMAPAFSDGFGDRENPSGEPGTHIDIEPVLQPAPLLADRK